MSDVFMTLKQEREAANQPPKLNLKQLYDLSVEKWGVGSQLNMLAEESTELALAALHLNRDNKDKAKAFLNLAEEIADTQFMIDEFIYLFKDREINGKSFFDWLIQFRKEKELRLAELLKTKGDKQ